MKRNRLFFTFSILALISMLSYAQSVDEILGKYYEALGGIDKLRTIKSIKLTEKFVSHGNMEILSNSYYKLPEKIKYEANIQDQKSIYAYDGENAWYLMPVQGITQPTILPEDEAKRIKDMADFLPLLDYEKKGSKLELLGKDDIDGKEVFKIKLTRKNGTDATYFLDTNSGLVVKVRRTMIRGEAEFIAESVYKDYRKVDWFMVPFCIETTMDGNPAQKILLQKLELNPKIDDSLFQMPSSNQ